MTYYAHLSRVGARLSKDFGSGPRGCVAVVAKYASGAHSAAFGQVFQVVEIVVECFSADERLVCNGTSAVWQASKSGSSTGL